MSETIHENPGMDFQLRLLGLRDRAAWDIVARDNRLYSSAVIYGRPDWVLCHRTSGDRLVSDYKNRILGEGDATDYEKLEVVIYATLVADAVFRETGRVPVVAAQLLYADETVLTVEYDEGDIDMIVRAAPEAATAMYFLGVTPEPRDTVSVTHLARYLVDPTFSDPRFGPSSARRAGIAAHRALLASGPGLH